MRPSLVDRQERASPNVPKVRFERCSNEIDRAIGDKS